MPQELSETRAKDRKAMAAAVVRLAEACGATATISDGPYQDLHEVRVQIQAAQTLGVNICFRRKSPHARPNTFVLSWNMRGGATLKPEHFPYDSVNPHHFQKATQVCEGLESLLETLKDILVKAHDGSLFGPQIPRRAA